MRAVFLFVFLRETNGRAAKKCIINKQKANETTSDAALNLGFESSAVFKQANYMNYELHDCYAHKFINYETFRSFICNSFVFAKSFAILVCGANNEFIDEQKEYRKNVRH